MGIYRYIGRKTAAGVKGSAMRRWASRTTSNIARGAALMLCLAGSMQTLAFSRGTDKSGVPPIAGKMAGVGNRQLSFIENKGQVTDQYNKPRKDIQYKIEAQSGLTIFVGDGAIHYQYNKLASKGDRGSRHSGTAGDATYSMYRMDVELVGADKNAMASAEGEGSYYERYDANGAGAATAHTYSRITYKNVYPHIDWVLYAASGKLKHEFVVHRGGRVSDIKLNYSGANALQLKKDGSLYAATPMGEITEEAPYAYQQDGKAVSSGFVLNGTKLSYKMGSFNGDLVIDPTLRWGTYYGGTNVDGFLDMTRDVSGNVYMTGPTLSSSNIATTGAHLTTFTFVGFSIGYLVKFDSSGNRLWGTYYGSNAGVIPWSVVTDASGNVYIGGGTNSSTGIATSGSYQSTYGGGTDGFLAKFNSAGVRQWGTYFGGSGGDSCFSIAIDATGNIYTTGTTASTSGIATSGAFQTVLGGNTDAYMAKFNSSGSLLWATYFGGTGADAWGACNVDDNGNAYVFGNTSSTSGIASPGAFQSTYGGGAHDLYIAKFNSAGGRIWSTYYGGDGNELGLALASDHAGHIYAGGRSFGSTSGFATPGAHQTTHGGMDDGFLAQFDTSGTRIWCTYYGADSSDYLDCITPIATGGVYIGGFSRSLSAIASSDGYKTTNSGDYDAFIARFNSAGVRQWGTYYGGAGQDGFGSLYYDGAGNIYGAGATKSTTAIATSGSYQSAQGGNGDAFLVKFYDCVPDAGTIMGASTVGERFFVTLTSSVAGGTWSVSNSNATISADGVLTGVTAGNVIVTYSVSNSCGSSSVTKNITVTATTGDITGSLNVCVGSTSSLSFPGVGGSWTSGNTAVATVGLANGVVSGLAVGTAPITFTSTYGGIIATTTVNALPDAGSISGAASVTAGATTTLSSTVSGGVWTASNSNATVGSEGVVTGVTAGAVTISYSVTNSCGTAVATKMMTVNAAVGAITGTLQICAGTNTTLGNSAPGGTWSSGNTAVATVSSAGVVTGVSAGTAIITYAATGGEATAIVTVDAAPSAIAGSSSLCIGNTTTLTNTESGGSWTSSNTTVATIDATTGIASALATGTTTISYMISTGCAATIVMTVGSVPGGIGGVRTICGGSTTTLTGTGGGSWTSSNTTVATVNIGGVVTGNASGTATITYALGTGCYATAVVTVYGLPAAIGGTATVCEGATTNLNDMTTGGSWSSGDNTVATVSATGVVTGVTAGTVDIYYTSAAGCVRSVTVTVNPNPSVSGTATLCPGTTTTLSTTISGGAWTGGSAPVATVGTGGVVTGMGAGTTNITYTITGCKATITITVNPAPATITGTMKACLGTTTTLGDATAGGAWGSDDASVATIGAGDGVVTGITAGTVAVSYTTAAGCSRSAVVTINADPAAITGTMITCAGSTTTLSDVTPGLSWTSGNTGIATINTTGVVTGVSNGTAVITYTAASTNCTTTAIVTVNGVPATIGGPATGCVGTTLTLTNSVSGGVWISANTATATVDAAGVVTGVASGIVNITYATGAGCYKTKQLTFNGSPTVSGYAIACVGLTTTLSGGASGTWNSSTPSVATIVTSGGYVSGVSAGTATMTFTSTGTGCTATYVVTVIPVPSAITGPAQACTGAVLALTNSTPGGIWTSANTANATVGSATGITTIVGTGGSVTISYSFGSNCRATKAITLKPLPAVFVGTPTVCTPVTTTLTTTTSGGTWASSDVSVATVGTAISASYGLITGVSAGTTEITYTITATGCARSTVVTVNAGLNPGTITSSGGFTLHTVSAPTSVTLSSNGASGGSWSSSNTAVATVNSSTGVVTAVAAGTTTITYAVTASCTNITTKVITVTAGREIGNMQSAVGSVQLYPNPTTGSFTLVSEEAGTLSVFSIDGRAITSYDINAGTNPLSLPRELSTGIYLCRYTGDNGNTTIVRLVYE